MAPLNVMSINNNVIIIIIVVIIIDQLTAMIEALIVLVQVSTLS